MHIRDVRDLEPQSEGFFNRGAESINIMGNMISDIFEGLGNVLSGGVSTIPHGSHLSGHRVSFAQANTGNIQAIPTPEDAARIRAVDRTVPKSFIEGFASEQSRLQEFIDKDNPII